MGRHLIRLAPAVGIIAVMVVWVASASGEALAAQESGVSTILMLGGRQSVIELGWLPDEPGAGVGCSEAEADGVLGASLVVTPGLPVGGALYLGLCRVTVWVGFGDMWGARVGAQSRPGGGVALVGWIERREVAVCGRLVTGRERDVEDRRWTVVIGGE